MLDAIYAWLELLEARVNLAMSYARSALSTNRAFTRPNASPPHTPNTGAAQINLVAMVVKATKSGRFLCHFEVPFTGATSTDTYDLQVNVDQSVGVPTLINSGGAGDSVANGCTGGAQSVQISASAVGATITTPVAATVLQYDSGALEIDTTGTGVLRWSGFVAGVPVGQWAIIRMSVALSGGVFGGTCSDAYAIEQP